MKKIQKPNYLIINTNPNAIYKYHNLSISKS